MPPFTARVVEPSVTADLRRSVLRPWLTAGDPLPGDDEQAVHIGAFSDGSSDPVGACLVLPEPCPFTPELPGAVSAWRLRSMATSPYVRGQGAGAAALSAAVDLVRGSGASVLWCHAREAAEGFYLRHGWSAVGDLFTEIGIPHRNMYRTV